MAQSGKKGRRAAAADLREFAQTILVRAGLRGIDSRRVVDNLLDADLRGVHSHGLVRIGPIVSRVQAGGINPRAEVRVVSDRGASILLDGDGGPGQIAGHKAMTLAIARARELGVGVAGVCGSNHYGTAGYYARMATEEEMIGLSVSNTGASMAPWGGTTPTYGTNPLAIAVPSSGEYPLMLDIALSRAAWGKVLLYLSRGDPLPRNWVLDRQGQPTTDPEEALKGMPSPLGDHKGYGLAVMVDILSGVLTGALFGRGVSPTPAPSERQDTGHFFLAISVEHFMEPELFLSRIQDYIQQLKSSELISGVDEILVPGEPDWRAIQRSLEEGIVLDEETWKILHRLSDESGVPLPEPQG